QAAPSSAGLAQATAPDATKDCTTSGRTSHTRTGKSARSSDLATPPPIDPSPITPTLGLFIRPRCSVARTTAATPFMVQRNAWLVHRARLVGTGLATFVHSVRLDRTIILVLWFRHDNQSP